MAGFLFGHSGYNLKSELIKHLKPFSQIKAEYGIDSIYRTGEIDRFSETSQRFGLSGVPTSRPSTRPLDETGEDGANIKVDTLQPIWYAAKLEDSVKYCYKDIENWERMQKMFESTGTTLEKYSKMFPKPVKCGTYQYVPGDISIEKKKKLLFLDITGKVDSDMADGEKIYTLDEDLMREIFKIILEKYKNDIVTDSDDEPYMCVNSPCKDTFTIKEILTSYCKSRSSDLSIDTFFTLELFHIIQELNIEEEFGCVFMGYFHGDVISTELGEDEITGHMPAEFAIPYRNSINKNYIDFLGPIKLGGKSSKRMKNKQHNKKTIRNIQIYTKSRRRKKIKPSNRKTLRKN